MTDETAAAEHRLYPGTGLPPRGEGQSRAEPRSMVALANPSTAANPRVESSIDLPPDGAGHGPTDAHSGGARPEELTEANIGLETVRALPQVGAGHGPVESHPLRARPDETPEAKARLEPSDHVPRNGGGRTGAITRALGAAPEETRDGLRSNGTHTEIAVAGGGRSGVEPQVLNAPASEQNCGQNRFDRHRRRAAVDEGEGQALIEPLSGPALPDASPDIAIGGPRSIDARSGNAADGDGPGDQAGRQSIATRPGRADLIATIRATHRQKEQAHKLEKHCILTMKGNCRMLCDGDKAAGTALYGLMIKQAPALVSATDGAAVMEVMAVLSDSVRVAISANRIFFESFLTIQGERKAAEKRLVKASKELPVNEWWVSNHGLSDLGLAQIVGECGDLWHYDSVSKLWRRLGLHVEGDGRAARRRAGVDNGFNAARRSACWRVANPLFKSQTGKVDEDTGEVLKETGPYRDIYDRRKAYELARTDVPEKAINPKTGQIRPIVAHMRALRYMEKRLIRHLWQKWRDPNAVLSFGMDARIVEEQAV